MNIGHSALIFCTLSFLKHHSTEPEFRCKTPLQTHLANFLACEFPSRQFDHQRSLNACLSPQPQTQCDCCSQDPLLPHKKAFNPLSQKWLTAHFSVVAFQTRRPITNTITSPRSSTTASRDVQGKRVMGFFSRKKDEVKKEKSGFGFSKPTSSNDWPTKPPKKSGRDCFKPRNGPEYPFSRGGNTHHGFQSRPTRASMQMLAALPPVILERIFSFVCPHSQDESYETCEQSALGDACMLCDLRDLAYAGLACKKWRASAIKVM